MIIHRSTTSSTELSGEEENVSIRDLLEVLLFSSYIILFVVRGNKI